VRRSKEFRLFYNQTIHPELLRMERKRKRLLFLFVVSFMLLGAAVFIQFYLNILVVSLVLFIPIGFYLTYLIYRIQRFRSTFKPHVVNLILDFIDDGLNYGTLKYDSKRSIKKEKFIASQLFGTEAPFYQGEDFISGKIGELDFEMCELNVKEYSKVRNRLNYVFRGIFLHTTFNLPLRGKILVLPREFKQYLSRSIRAFNTQGGEEYDTHLEERFKKLFMTFATKEANATSLLSTDMQNAIVKYRHETKKEIYISFIERDIYIGITNPKDILEPYIFRSNVSFELVREFFEDIEMMMSIVEYFDENN
jgi:hypothetical protein